MQRPQPHRSGVVKAPHRAPESLTARIFECDLSRANRSMPWQHAVEAAGTLEDVYLKHPFREVQDAWKPGPFGPVVFLINFSRFMVSERVLRDTHGLGYQPAHPRALAAVADFYPDLPHRLGVPAPMRLATLVPCYRVEHEPHVMSVSWDRVGGQAVKGVFYRYGWDTNYWLLFERISKKPAI